MSKTRLEQDMKQIDMYWNVYIYIYLHMYISLQMYLYIYTLIFRSTWVVHLYMDFRLMGCPPLGQQAVHCECLCALAKSVVFAVCIPDLGSVFWSRLNICLVFLSWSHTLLMNIEFLHESRSDCMVVVSSLFRAWNKSDQTCWEQELSSILGNVFVYT